MISHFIIMSSSYSKGRRIAMDYVISSSEVFEKALNDLCTIQEQLSNDVGISTHTVVAKSNKWSSVLEIDPFFEGVLKIESLSRFIDTIRKDRELKGLDIAKYIMSKHNEFFSHARIEKLVYFCYKDYFLLTGNKLFVDNIYAFPRGPIVGSVYKKYKGKNQISASPENDEDSLDGKFLTMPARSRILFSNDGIQKMNNIEKTLTFYEKCSDDELIILSEKDCVNCKKTNGSKKWPILSDDMLKSYV